MKELSTEIMLRNGDIKTITVELETELADWLVLQPPAVYRDFLIFEYRSKCVERKETRRTQSLNVSLDHGFDIVDEESDLFIALLRQLTREEVRKAIKKLKPKQQWVAEQVLLLERTQAEVARELGISKPAMTQQISIIKRELKIFLKNF